MSSHCNKLWTRLTFLILQCPWYFMYGKFPVTELNFLPIANSYSWKSPQVQMIKLIFCTISLNSSNPRNTTICSLPAPLCLMGTEALLMPLTKVPHMIKFFISYKLLDILLSVERQCHCCETSYKIESI